MKKETLFKDFCRITARCENKSFFGPEDQKDKETFHKLGKKVMQQIADDLGLSKGSYDISNNKAGPAILGEVTLHTDSLYIQTTFCSGLRFLVRSCKGRKDYCGGTNLYYPIEFLNDKYPDLLSSFKSISKQGE